MNGKYQTITLVTADGRKLTYTGPAHLDPDQPMPAIVEVLVGLPRELPPGTHWSSPDVREEHIVPATAPVIAKKDPTMCSLCKKPIKGRIYYQGGQHTHPAHKGCRVSIGGPHP